jgi:hypothetical protein
VVDKGFDVHDKCALYRCLSVDDFAFGQYVLDNMVTRHTLVNAHVLQKYLITQFVDLSSDFRTFVDRFRGYSIRKVAPVSDNPVSDSAFSKYEHVTLPCCKSCNALQTPDQLFRDRCERLVTLCKQRMKEDNVLTSEFVKMLSRQSVSMISLVYSAIRWESGVSKWDVHFLFQIFAIVVARRRQSRDSDALRRGVSYCANVMWHLLVYSHCEGRVDIELVSYVMYVKDCFFCSGDMLSLFVGDCEKLGGAEVELLEEFTNGLNEVGEFMRKWVDRIRPFNENLNSDRYSRYLSYVDNELVYFRESSLEKYSEQSPTEEVHRVDNEAPGNADGNLEAIVRRMGAIFGRTEPVAARSDSNMSELSDVSYLVLVLSLRILQNTPTWLSVDKISAVTTDTYYYASRRLLFRSEVVLQVFAYAQSARVHLVHLWNSRLRERNGGNRMSVILLSLGTTASISQQIIDGVRNRLVPEILSAFRPG